MSHSPNMSSLLQMSMGVDFLLFPPSFVPPNWVGNFASTFVWGYVFSPFHLRFGNLQKASCFFLSTIGNWCPLSLSLCASLFQHSRPLSFIFLLLVIDAPTSLSLSSCAPSLIIFGPWHSLLIFLPFLKLALKSLWILFSLWAMLFHFLFEHSRMY